MLMMHVQNGRECCFLDIRFFFFKKKEADKSWPICFRVFPVAVLYTVSRV